MGEADLAGGAQSLVNQAAAFLPADAPGSLLDGLGGELTVDGAWGAGSQGAADAVLGALGQGPASADPAERLLQLARAYWLANPLRVDLY